MNTLLMVSDALLRALGWALAHSLWQATAAALLLLILMPRLQTARQRYWAAYAAMIAVFVAALVTAGMFYQPRQIVENTVAGTMEIPVGASIFLVGNEAPVEHLWQSFSAWLEVNHAIVVAMWLLGFGFFLLRLGGGLWQVQRLRTQGVSLPETAWLERFSKLSCQMGFSPAPRLLESTTVQTPMAIGWLKPVVLLPIGLVNRLSVAEVEAVLAHELAHIIRRDWIFNFLQAFIESLFYYHPAVWWVSSVIRRERENCCDDAALAATGNPLAFAKALVQVQEMAVPVPVLALGLSGNRRRPLLDRVRRILNQPQQQQHQVMEKITATVILLALLALVGLKANSVPTLEAAFSQIADIPNALFGGETDDNAMDSDSLPKPKSTRKITREDDNQRVEAEYKDGKLTRLNIDGKEIPETEFARHEALVEELNEDAPAAPRVPGHFEWPEAPEAPESPEHPEYPEPLERPELWEIPAAPDAPQGFRIKFHDPNAPLVPFPAMSGPVLLFSGKDTEGNAVIRLDNSGESTELVVKGSDVFVNGRKWEKGEALNLPGLRLGSNGAFLFPGGSYAYSSNEGNEIALEESHRAYEQDLKLATEEMARSQKDWEKEQKRWEKEQKIWEKEQKKWEKDQQKWQAEQQVWEVKSKAMDAALKKELLKDGLITDPNDFSLELNDQVFKVNKKKQSEALRKKYLELYESMSGQKLQGKGSFQYNYSNDDN
jgi:bla regulator protein BlaR1